MASHIASSSADVLALPSDLSVEGSTDAAAADKAAAAASDSVQDAPATAASTQEGSASALPVDADFIDLMKRTAGLTLHEFQTVAEVVFAEAAAFQAVCFADLKQFADDDT